MFDASFWQTLPDTLRQPTAIAAFVSVIVHGVFFSVFPLLTASQTNEPDSQRVVGVVELTPQEQSQLPQSALTSQVPLPPLQIQKGTSAKPPAGNTLLPPSLLEPYKIPDLDFPSSSFLPPLVEPPIQFNDPLPSDRPRVTRSQPIPKPQPSSPSPTSSTAPSPTAPSPTPTPTPSNPAPANPVQPSPAPASPTPTPSPAPKATQPSNIASVTEAQREFAKGITYDPAGTDDPARSGSFQSWYAENITKKLGSISDDQLDSKLKETNEAYPLRVPLADFNPENYKPAVVAILVDPTGKPLADEPTLLQSTGYGEINKAALKAVKQLMADKKFPPTSGKYVIYQFKMHFAPPR